MSTPEYHAYMTFAQPELEPWHPDTISRYLADLGAVHTTVTAEEVDGILFCYDQSPNFRYYHGPDHGAFVGQPDVPPALAALLSDRTSLVEAQADMAIKGLFHDAAYKHVDALEDGTRAWPSALREKIGDFVDYVKTTEDGKTVFRTVLTENGRGDPLTQMVAHIFNVGPEGIIHNQGGNEFDSALAAAIFLQGKGVPPKYIVSAVAGIAATVPFKPAIGEDASGNKTDGHIGELAERVKSVRYAVNGVVYEPDWQDTNDIMLLGVHLANRDISPFIQQDNFAGIIRGGRAIKAEEIPELRPQGETTISALARAAGLGRSAALLYQGLGSGSIPVPAANVPHIYIPRDNQGQIGDISTSYPPFAVYETAVANTERNARLASLFFRSHEAGIVTAACIATLIGEPDAAVPGMVHARLWRNDAIPHGARFDDLSADELLVYNELMHGAHQEDIGKATPQRSPIGGLLLGAVGSEGMAYLSSYIKELRDQAQGAGGAQDPFSDPVVAKSFIRDLAAGIGAENFDTIFSELRRVARFFADDPTRGAPDRAARLSALQKEIIG